MLTEKENKMSASNTQVVYIHGFNSSVKSETLSLLQKDFPDAFGLTYDHTDPEASIKLMVNQLRQLRDKNLVIVGSSLGGWYAEKLTPHIIADFILYNPATQPEKSLAQFGVAQETLYLYKYLSPSKLPQASRNVIISIDDEVIDPVLADNKYKNVADMSYTAGGHRMTKEAMDIIINKIKFLENQITI
jgi:predicted esterase YcpF (UPF0227 family)